MALVRSNIIVFFLTALVLITPAAASASAFPLILTDAEDRRLNFTAPPRRVACLLPYVTEMLLTFDQEPVLVGVTRHDMTLNSALRKPSVGSYFHPDLDALQRCQPDLIIAAPSHAPLIESLHSDRCKVMFMEVHRLADAFDQMAMLGRLFDCEERAEQVVRDNRDRLARVEARLAALPVERRKRVVRVMAGETVMCPGDGAFQNEMIAAAGGIVPRWGKSGFAVPVALDAWQRFDPQVIYGCHENAEAVKKLLDRDGWRAVSAVQNGAVLMFPCELTCQASTRVGAFVQWLSATLYPDTFADPQTAVQANTVLGETAVTVPLPYVDRARVLRHRVADAHYKSVVVEFKRPTAVLSTLEGPLQAIKAVGNTYVPMHASLGHMIHGIAQVQRDVATNMGFATHEYAGLMTGAHMDNLAIREETHENLRVVALVTAGVKGNAMRMSRDTGACYKLGTINIIVMTNRSLSAGSMALAIITATEAKTAALLDMDIRSSYTPLDFRATGTGTDNIIVVQGEGPEEPFTGGHTKIGELIARAVHAGVTEAIYKQNGLRADRGLLQRLADRKLSLEGIVAHYPINMDPHLLASRLEQVLSTPFYASFLESALTISDDYNKGLIRDLAFLDAMCGEVAARLAGREDLAAMDVSEVELPTVLAKALGALVMGMVNQEEVGK